MSAKKEPKNRKKKHKLITKGHGKEPTVIEFNLSKAVILLIIIGVVIAGLVTKEIVTTIIEAKQNNALAEDGTDEEHAVYVQSSDGKQVPVPKGYVASQIPGETSVNDGFVIYEDNYNGKSIDWNSILVETNSLSANSLNANNAINSTTQQAPTENQAKDEEQLKTEQTTTTENTSAETTTTTEATNKTETTDTESTNSTESTTTEETNATENTTLETTNKTQATNKTESTNTEQTNTETTSTEKTNTEAINTVENNTEETNTKPTTTSTNTISTRTTTTATETNKTTTNSATGNEKEENKTESTIEPNKTATQKTTETTNESPKVQTNAQATSKESSIELYADGTITQEDINIFNLQKSVNQFVWVPVNEISRIYGVDSNGKLWGKLYEYDETGRTPLNWTENGKMNIVDLGDYREPAILSEYDTDSRLQTCLGGKTAYELLAEMEENYYEAIKSIEKYGGFYIGRYETGGLSETAVVRKMETDINNQTWYTMYEKMKEISGSNDSVMTSMIWGALWDETLQWLIDSKATTSDGTELTYELVGLDSTLWGNYLNSTFNYIPEGATEPNPTAKHEEDDWFVIPTGSSEYTKVNNIYDMAGNVYDWILELDHVYFRVLRGGRYNNGGSSYPASGRYISNPTNTSTQPGCRTSLYIK